MVAAALLTHPKLDTLLRQLSASAIEATPEHWQQIIARVRFDRPRQELQYELSCPAFPAETTMTPSPEMQFTGHALRELFTSHGEIFFGCTLTMTLGEDRQWKNEVDLDEA